MTVQRRDEKNYLLAFSIAIIKTQKYYVSIVGLSS